MVVTEAPAVAKWVAPNGSTNMARTHFVSHQFLSQEDRQTDDTKQTTPTRSPGPPKAPHPQEAAAAPLGHAAGNRVRGAQE